MHLVRGRQLERWTRVNLLCKKKTNECKSLFTPPHALKPLLYLFQLLRLLASSTKKMRIMLKVTPTVKTKRLNVNTVKLDTHGTFAGVCSA